MIALAAFVLWVLFHPLPVLVAYLLAVGKDRSRVEGFLLGFFLSWLGVVIEAVLRPGTPGRSRRR